MVPPYIAGNEYLLIQRGPCERVCGVYIMFLLEHEGKEILRRYGVRTPRGIVVTRDDLDRLDSLVEEYPVIVKAQFLFGGRGKAGAVKKADNAEELREVAEKLFQLEVRGARPERLLIEEFVPHEEEYYISIMASKSDKSLLLLASRYGGVDVEELARMGRHILRISLSPDEAPMDNVYRAVAKTFFGSVERDLVSKVAGLVKPLFEAVLGEDLLLVEINPLVFLGDGFMALDAKVIVDDNAGFRRDVTGFYEYNRSMTEGERIARETGFAYVPLKGDIAVIGNGAGLVMATLDLVKYYGGEPACFLDVGGGASADRIAKALEVVYKEVSPKKIFINIFAGITRCDEVAKGIVEAVDRVGIPPEMFVIRLVGTLEDVGREILESRGFRVYKDMDEAAKEVVKA